MIRARRMHSGGFLNNDTHLVQSAYKGYDTCVESRFDTLGSVLRILLLSSCLAHNTAVYSSPCKTASAASVPTPVTPFSTTAAVVLQISVAEKRRGCTQMLQIARSSSVDLASFCCQMLLTLGSLPPVLAVKTIQPQVILCVDLRFGSCSVAHHCCDATWYCLQASLTPPQHSSSSTDFRIRTELVQPTRASHHPSQRERKSRGKRCKA